MCWLLNMRGNWLISVVKDVMTAWKLWYTLFFIRYRNCLMDESGVFSNEILPLLPSILLKKFWKTRRTHRRTLDYINLSVQFLTGHPLKWRLETFVIQHFSSTINLYHIRLEFWKRETNRCHKYFVVHGCHLEGCDNMFFGQNWDLRGWSQGSEGFGRGRDLSRI